MPGLLQILDEAVRYAMKGCKVNKEFAMGLVIAACMILTLGGVLFAGDIRKSAAKGKEIIKDYDALKDVVTTHIAIADARAAAQASSDEKTRLILDAVNSKLDSVVLVAAAKEAASKQRQDDIMQGLRDIRAESAIRRQP